MLIALIAATMSCILTWTTTPIVRRLALRYRIVAVRNHRTVHSVVTPKLGWVSLFPTFGLALILCVFCGETPNQVVGLLAASALAFLLGLVDDVRDVTCYRKLAVQTLAAGIAVYFGFRMEAVTFPGGATFALGAWAAPNSLLWIVGLTNAVNVLDGLDGLATGVAVAGVSLVRAANWGELFSNPICPTFPRHLSGMKASVDSIIHLHLPNPMAHLAYALVRPPGKLVVSWHSDIVRQKVLGKLYRRALHALLERADCIVATSPAYIMHSSFLRRHADKCVVVPLGINPEKFETSVATRRRVQLLQSRYGRPFVLFVGRLTYYKGLDALLQAADQINGNILIVGNGPLKQQISNEIKNRGLDGRVFLLTQVSHSDLVAFYHACDVFVLPSNQRSEAFGIVQLEAMICGKPVVSTDLRTGVPWVNVHKVTGLTVPVNDARRLAQAVNRLLLDAVERRRLGRNGRRRVLQNFTLEKVGERMERVYKMVLDGGIKMDFDLWEDAFALGDEFKANELLSAGEKT